MGDGGLEPSPTDPHALPDPYDETCAYYKAIGCPINEFWHGEPSNLKIYVRAHEIENEQKNQEMWWQGLYDYRAFEAVIGMFSWGLGGKKGSKPDGYIDKPIRTTPLTEAEERARAEKARQKIIADLTGWEQAWKLKQK